MAESGDGDDRLAGLDAFLDSINQTVVQAAAEQHHHHEHDHSAHSAPASRGHAGHDHSVHGTGHEGHMMKMWFHGGFEEVILFDCWRVNSWSGMLFSCILIFIMGAAYEGIKWFRVYLQMSQAAKQKCTMQDTKEVLPLRDCQKANSQEDIYNPTTTPPVIVRTNLKRNSPYNSDSPFSVARLSQAALYILQLILAYWLMLIVMTYNNYLTVAVILGAGFGHWLFAVLKFRNPLGETADSFATDACH